MNLKVKAILFSTIIATSFIAVMITSYLSAKERIQCNQNQKYEILYYTIKSQTGKLLDAMIYDYRNIQSRVLTTHQKVATLFKQNSNQFETLSSKLNSPFLDIAIFDLNFDLIYHTHNRNYTYKSSLLTQLPLTQTPFVSLPIYEPQTNSFVGYSISLIDDEKVLITAFEYENYEDILVPMREYIQNNSEIKDFTAIVECHNGFAYSLNLLQNSQITLDTELKKFKTLANSEENYAKKRTENGLETVYFSDSNHKNDISLSLLSRTLVDYKSYDDALNALHKELLLAIAVGFSFIVAAFIFIKQLFITPLEKMQKAIQAHQRLDDEKLLNQNDELGTLARNINDSFAMMNEQIQQKSELLHQQDIFVKDSIHEIRTPLTIITLNNELRDKIYGNDKYSKQILAATKSLNLAYDDLSFSIEQDRNNFEIEKINLSQLLYQRIEFIQIVAKASNKKIDLTACNDCFIHISYKELSRLIDNNLSNAIKYAYPNTTIEILLDCSDQNEVLLRFSSISQPIQNTAIIFDRYQREDDAKGGYGLGLNIVKKIAQKYQIKTEVESKEGINHFIYKFNKGSNL